ADRNLSPGHVHPRSCLARRGPATGCPISRDPRGARKGTRVEGRRPRPPDARSCSSVDREFAVSDLRQRGRRTLRNRNTSLVGRQSGIGGAVPGLEIASKSTWESCSSTYYNKVIIFWRTPPR